MNLEEGLRENCPLSLRKMRVVVGRRTGETTTIKIPLP
jgi:hypothetical protein